MRSLILASAILCALASACRANLVISQYYEGSTGTNKWIELFNTGPSAIDMTALGLRVGLWSNATAEGYKTSVAPSGSGLVTGTIASGATFVIGNTAATPIPSYVVVNQNINGAANFTGNDSVAIYTGATFNSANIIDAIGFTNSGNEGMDKSFERLTTAPGYDLTAGTNATNFSTWQVLTLAVVNSAVSGTNEYIGSAIVSVVPEASPALMGLVVCSVVGLAYGGRSLMGRKAEAAA